MGFVDQLLGAASNVGKLGAGMAEDAVRAFNEFAEARADERRWADIDDRMEKAAKKMAEDTKRDGGPGDLDGAVHNPAREPKALLFDPFDLVSAMGYRDRPSAFTYRSMEMVGRGVPVVSDVIRVRTTQVTNFCQRPEDRHSPGLKARLRDWRNQKMTKAAEKEAALLEDVLLNTGFLHPNRPQDGVSLKEFAAEAIADALIFDQLNFEIVPDRRGLPSYLRMVDPSTIRLLDPVAVKGPKDPFAVQVVEGSVVADFTKDELAFAVRNPRSGIRSFGYGLSEIETLVREITGFLWAMDYNRKFFTQGSATKGILNFKGTIPDKHLKAFRRQWYAMLAGVANAWKTPITNAEELQWINMQLSNRDMEYNSWMDFLIKIVCARYQIAPEEVNFSYGNTNQASAMGNTSTEEKLKASKDLGLRPLVHWFFEVMNRHLIQRLNPDFEIVPVGLDEKGVEAETELLSKQQQGFLTVNEARERNELPPLEEDQGGNVILNPTWLQFVQGKEQAAMMDEQGGFDEDEDGLIDEDLPDEDQDFGDDEPEDFDLDFGPELDSGGAGSVGKSEGPAAPLVTYIASFE